MAPSRNSKTWVRQRLLFHTKRLSVNTLLQICSQILPLIAGAVAIPLLYKNVGREDFGAITVGLSALGLFSLLDLGLGRAAVRFMSRAFAVGDYAVAGSVAAQSGLILCAFSLLLTALSAAAIPFATTHWIHSFSQSPETLEECLFILVIALPFAGLTSVFRAILEAKERFYAISLIQGSLGILTYISPLALSYATRDVRVIIAGPVICRCVAFLAFGIVGMSAWEGPFVWRRIDFRAHADFRRFSIWMVISNIVGSVIVYGDRALLVKMFGLAEVPFYNVPLELLGRAMIVVNSAVTVVFPSLSRASENTEVFEDVYVNLSTLLSLIVGLVLLSIAIATPYGLQLWLGLDFRDHSTSIVRILLVGVAFQTLNVFAMASLNARGFARPITFMHLIETPVYFLSLYQVGSRLGLNGVALVWSVRVAVEYGGFSVFQNRLGTRGGTQRRIVGFALSLFNFCPLALIALGYATHVSIIIALLGACLTVSWVSSFFRDSRSG